MWGEVSDLPSEISKLVDSKTHQVVENYDYDRSEQFLHWRICFPDFINFVQGFDG